MGRQGIANSAQAEYSGANTVEIRLLPEAARTGAGRESYVGTLVAGGAETATPVCVVARQGADLTFIVDGRRIHAVGVEVAPEQWEVRLVGLGADTMLLRWRSPLPTPGAATRSADSLAAPMPGQVIAVHVTVGQRVRAGEPLLALEAMKMEHTVRAPHDGIVVALHAQAGEQVAAAALLVEVRADTIAAPAPADL